MNLHENASDIPNLALVNVGAATLLRPTKLWTCTDLLARPCPVQPQPVSMPGPSTDARRAFRSTRAFERICVALCRDLAKASECGRQSESPNVTEQTPLSLSRKRRRFYPTALARCLLSQSLGIELRRVGSGRRMTFGAGERALNDWLERSARVAWLACDEPWRIEEHMIRSVSLPLNLDQNRHHNFHSYLSEIRRAAKARARSLPVV